MKKEDFNGASGPSHLTGASDKDIAERYDPVSLMFKERVVLVQGQVDTNMAVNIISQLKKLEYLDPTAPITMLINSPGGSVIDGFAIYDIMRESKCQIRTVGNGMQASMGSILLAGGDERLMMKNSMVLVHQIMGGAEKGTQHSDFEISGAFMAQQHERLKSVYVEFTGLSHNFWDVVGERDTWLTAEQAVEIGFVHRVVQNEKPGGPYAEDAVRVEKKGLQAALDKTTQTYIAKMSADDIVKAINSGNAEGGVYARLRGELVTKLSKFPEYWTAGKKAVEAKKAAEAKQSNDNKADAPAPAVTEKKKVGGPKAP